MQSQYIADSDSLDGCIDVYIAESEDDSFISFFSVWFIKKLKPGTSLGCFR